MKGKKGKTIEIECLVCGEIVKIPNLIDIEDYDGQLTCQKCRSLLQVKLVGSKVNKYRVVKKRPRQLTAEEYYQIKREAEKEIKEFEAGIRGENG